MRNIFYFYIERNIFETAQYLELTEHTTLRIRDRRTCELDDHIYRRTVQLKKTKNRIYCCFTRRVVVVATISAKYLQRSRKTPVTPSLNLSL